MALRIALAVLASLGVLPGCSDGGIPERPFEPIDDRAFPKGPYLTWDTPTEVAILWESVEPCAGTVHLGRSARELSLSFSEDEAVVQHRILATGLRPDARYFYQVSSCGVQSAVHVLYTAPDPGRPVRFAVVGDTHNRPDVSSRVVEEILAAEPYFLLHVGDLTDDGLNAPEWDVAFFSPFRKLLASVPVFAAIGNHERNSDLFYRLFQYPAQAPGFEAGTNYALTFGNVFVLVVDMYKAFFPIAETDTPLSAWIRERVASEEAQAARFRVAIFHEAGYSESWSPGSCDDPDSFAGNPWVRTFLYPLLAAHGFAVAFSGHTHAYERGRADSMSFIITGGGGGDLDEHCRDLPEIDVVRAVHHHLEVEATPERLVISAHALGESVPFETWTIEAP